MPPRVILVFPFLGRVNGVAQVKCSALCMCRYDTDLRIHHLDGF